MLGKWDTWFVGIEAPEFFGDTTTYALGAEWLADCDVVEDWGCGKGGLRTLIPATRYRGIDGSQTPFADITTDLTTYHSNVCGVFIRHVLEHNFEWSTILRNACRSAQRRFFLAIFTPPADHTHQIAWNDDPGVPDLAFNPTYLTNLIDSYGFNVATEQLATQTQYGVETVFRAKRVDYR